MRRRYILAAASSVALFVALTTRLCADSHPSFDGTRAYQHVRHLVEIGPRPPASEGIRLAQIYIIGQLKSFGCPVEEHDFYASTALGDLAMKNIVVKLPAVNSGIILYTTHYDTVRIPNFVGADDGGSGTGTMLELARLFCARKNSLNVWLAFFDGDADMIGPPEAKITRDTNSTPWLTEFIWATAAQLGYQTTFVDRNYPVTGDDHLSFIRRGVAGCDLIDFSIPYWHTTQDTIDKIDPKSLAIVGEVLAETLPGLEKRFR